MDDFKKILSGGVVAAISGFITEWTKILYQESLVHPDWSGHIDGDAMLWSVIAVIALYVAVKNYSKPKLVKIVYIFTVVFVVLLVCCVVFSKIVPGIDKAAVADALIYVWSWVFIAADVASVCTGMTFGLWLAAKPPSGATP